MIYRRITSLLLAFTTALAASQTADRYMHCIAAEQTESFETVGTDIMSFRICSDHAELRSVSKEAEGSIVVPREVGDVPLTVIGEAAALGSAEITSVTIPDTVTRIGDNAFSLCRRLETLELPGSVTEIGNDAFGGCTSLKSVTLPDSVVSTGNGLFSGCSQLRSVTLSGSQEKISDATFRDCMNLTDVHIPDSVTEIGDMAFTGCDSLQNINIPCSVRKIGGDAFGHSGLRTIDIPDSVTEVKNGFSMGAFHWCKRLVSVNISDSLDRIGTDMFQGCGELREIVVPETVKCIDYVAFNYCEKLEAIVILNPECVICDRADTICSNRTHWDEKNGKFVTDNAFKGTIYGYGGSTAQAYAKKYGYKFMTIKLGDVNGDGIIDAVDASGILGKYADSSSGEDIFRKKEHILGDVNRDGCLDAVDASDVLAYYAYISGSGKLSLEEFLEK